MSTAANQSEAFARNLSESMSRHDLLASLAILKGYGKALDASFGQLKVQIDCLATSLDDESMQPTLGEIAALEAECSLFIARIQESSEQLSVRLSEAYE